MYSVIFDTDPGIDDAVAISVLLHQETLDLKLITTVAGNAPVHKTTANARKLLDFFGKSVPLAAGAVAPLVAPYVDAEDVHGDTGMNGYDFPEPVHPVMAKHAVEAMRDVLLASKEKVMLLPVGPLTNVALLLRMYPEVKEHIGKIILMGGSTERGNMSPYAEFNIYVDPEAAEVVFNCGLPVVMCGLNMTSDAVLLTEDIEHLSTLGRAGDMLGSLVRFYHGATGNQIYGARMHDLTTVAYLTHPEFFTTQPATVHVELSQGYTRGATAVDFKHPGLVDVCTAVDNDLLKAWLFSEVERIETL